MRIRFSLLAVFVAVLCIAPLASADDIPIPEYLGAFALVDSALMELEYFEFDTELSGSELFPSILPDLANSPLIVYGDYSPSAIYLNRVSSSFSTGELVQESIRVRIKPQSGLQGLIGSLVVVEPRKALEPGHYLLGIEGTDDVWGFNLASPNPFFMDPVYEIAELDGDIVAGTMNGLFVYSGSGTRYLPIPGADESGLELKIGNIRYAESGTNARVDGGRVVSTLALEGMGASYIYFRLSDGEVRYFGFPELKDGFFKVKIAKYYDMIFPSIDPEYPWYGMTAYHEGDEWEEAMGLFAVPKDKPSFFGIGTIEVEGPGPFNTSDWYAKSVGDRLYCFAEAVPETMFVATDEKMLRSVWVPDKNEWDGFSDVDDGPENVVFLSRCVEGAMYAITAEGSAYRTQDTGASWEAFAGLANASKVDISPGDNSMIACLRDGELSLSKDAGASFASVSIGGQKVNDVRFAAAGNGTVLAGTDKGLYRSDDAGATWAALGE